MNEKLKENVIKRLDYLMNEKGLADWVPRDFKKKGEIYWSERSPLGGILYWLNDAGGCPKHVQEKVAELTNENQICYFVTHEYTDFGELYDYWLVTEEDLEDEDLSSFKDGYQFVLSENKDFDWCSDYGDIQYKIMAGGPIRVG